MNVYELINMFCLFISGVCWKQ